LSQTLNNNNCFLFFKMLHIKTIRENADIVHASEEKRGRDPIIVKNLLEIDGNYRSELKILEELRATRNLVSEEINTAKKNGNNDDATHRIAKMREVVTQLKEQDEKVTSLLEKRNTLLKTIGNILHKAVPSGKDENENVEIKQVGEKPTFDFELKDSQELGENLDLFELETAAKVAGARFFYLKNEAVLLDMALQKFAVDMLIAKGFGMVWPPFMLNRSALEGGVNVSEFEDTIYKIENEDLYLIATSEHPLIALKQNQTLHEKDLPIKVGGISTCFRKELGSHGRDTKGIFRVHQFNKVEQVMYCTPETSYKYYDEIQQNSEDLFKALGLPYRVVNICSGDIGNKQALQYDIEAWFPGHNNKQGAWREVTSCSNCTDYQSVTANIKFLRDETGEKEYVHILNNTALATARVIVAILENFQTKEGTVKIPEVLWPYMNGITEIKKK
jgi:seryl-tRNA synthetase